MKDMLGFEVYEGDIVVYPARSGSATTLKFFIVSKCETRTELREHNVQVDGEWKYVTKPTEINDVSLRGFKRSWYKNAVTTYVRRIYSPQSMIRVNTPTKLDFRDPIICALMNYRAKYYPYTPSIWSTHSDSSEPPMNYRRLY